MAMFHVQKPGVAIVYGRIALNSGKAAQIACMTGSSLNGIVKRLTGPLSVYRRKRRMKLIVILVVLGLLALGLRFAVPYLGNSVAKGVIEQDGQQMLADCPDTPNCHRDTFPVTADPTQAISTLADIVTRQDGAKIVSQNERYLHAIYTSRLMGFVDDVEFLLVARGVGTQPSVLVRSASRLGKSDLGANAKRVDMLRSVSHQQL